MCMSFRLHRARRCPLRPDHAPDRARSTSRHTLWLLAAMALTGCAVPPHMQVVKGLSPENVNDDVRFRVTYYFRVFDYCADSTGSGVIRQPVSVDALYRYRMTGKANSLTNAVHFESGTLTAAQIDPFGATVAFDDRNRQFYFKSQSTVRQEAFREQLFDELDRLLDRYESVRARLGATRQESGVSLHEALVVALADAGITPSGAQTTELVQVVRTGLATVPQADEKTIGGWIGSTAVGKANAAKTGDLAKRVEAYVARREAPTMSPADEAILAELRRSITQQIGLIQGAQVTTPADTIIANAALRAASGKLKMLRAANSTLDESAGAVKGDVAVAAAAGAVAAAGLGATPGAPEAVTAAAEAAAASAATAAEAANSAATAAAAEAARRSSALTPTTTQANHCTNLRRGFQVLGPEGWRTFDQDERLILAMSSSGKPLISTMKELSGRVLANQPPAGIPLAVLAPEELRIARAEG
jgi:hypothetical protein